MLILLTVPAGWAQDVEADWPDDIDYPPSSLYTPQEDIDNPIGAAKRQIAEEKAHKKSEKDKEKDKKDGAKKKWWSLGVKKKQKEYIPTEEEIVNVGPRIHPSAAEPLFRLPMSLRGANGQTIAAGFYLVRQQTGPDGVQRLQLIQEGRLVYEVTAHPCATPPSATSPVTSEIAGPVISMKAPQTSRAIVESRVSPDFASLTIVVRQNGSEFRTDPIPTIANTRKPLPF